MKPQQLLSWKGILAVLLGLVSGVLQEAMFHMPSGTNKGYGKALLQQLLSGFNAPAEMIWKLTLDYIPAITVRFTYFLLVALLWALVFHGYERFSRGKKLGASLLCIHLLFIVGLSSQLWLQWQAGALRLFPIRASQWGMFTAALAIGAIQAVLTALWVIWLTWTILSEYAPAGLAPLLRRRSQPRP